MIPFNRPVCVGKEKEYVLEVLESQKWCGDGKFNRQASALLRDITGSPAYLTSSCTMAMEMAMVLFQLNPGDEVILPSFTFTSTATAVSLFGGVPVFVDCLDTTLNIDPQEIEKAITKKTKGIVAVHYAGVSCDMKAILKIAQGHNLWVLEDAAQALMATYEGKQLGTLGDLGAYSFHETKNVSSGEGGALLVNRKNLEFSAEIVREKGTNRSQFFRGEVDKYTWQMKGSSYLMSDLDAAVLFAQLEKAKEITQNRIDTWNFYHESLVDLEAKGKLRRPIIPQGCQHNAHLYYILLPTVEQKQKVFSQMREKGIGVSSHYVPLHQSPAGLKFGRPGSSMEKTLKNSEALLRLPLFFNLTQFEKEFIAETLHKVFR